MLHGSCVQRFANTPQISLSLGPIVARDPHLDQFVALEIDVDLLEHCVREALVAYHDHGGEAVRAGLERLALKRGQLNDHGRLAKTGILGNGA
jgi:hypothetical protein